MLYISSYHPGLPTFSQQVNGLKDTLGDSVVLDIEFMDMKRFPDHENYRRFRTDISYKLTRSNPYNAVIVGDDYAFNFALTEQNDLFKGIPIIFLGVNDLEKAFAQDANSRITGVIEQVSMRETIETAISIHHEINRIVAIVDGTASGQEDLNKYNTLQSQFPQITLDVLNLSELSWMELSDSLSRIDNKSVLLLLSAYTDRNQVSKSFDDSLELVLSATEYPIYHLWSHGIGKGLMGGKIISHFNQGVEAGKLVQMILSGTDPEQIKVEKESPNQYLFDYSLLKSYDLDLSVLPDDTEFIHRPNSFISENRYFIIYILLVFFILIGLIIILVWDIRKRHKTEQELIQIRSVLDQSPISVIVTDSSGSIIYINRYLSELTGYSPNEIIGENPRIFSNPQSKLTNYKELWMTITSGSKWEGLLYNRKKNGMSYTERAIIKPVLDNNGVIQNYIGVKEDITEKLKQEQTNNMLMAAIEQTDDVVEILNRSKKLIYTNPAFETKYGYSSEEAIGRDPTELFNDGSEENVNRDRDMWNALYSGNVWRGQFRNKTKNSSFLIEDISISPVFDNQGEPLFYVSVKKDITEMLNVIDERDNIKEELFQNQKLESIGHLTTGIAHDFNNILSGIMSASQLLLRKIPESEVALKKYGEMILTNCDRAAQLVSKLLNFSQRRKTETELVDLSIEISDVLSLLKHTVKKDIQYKFLNSSRYPFLYFEKSSIHNIVLNLAINSTHAISRKGEIIFELDDRELGNEYCHFSEFDLRPGKYKCITVKDNGCGIPEDSINKIFRSFYTSKENGTGLGLATIKRIIEDNKGAIEVESRLEIGTSFRIFLPSDRSAEKEN